MTTEYRPKSPQLWVTSFFQPEEVIKADFEKFTMHLSATFTLDDEAILQRLKELSAAAEQPSMSTVPNIGLKRGILKKLETLNHLQVETGDAYMYSSTDADSQLVKLGKEIITDFSHLGPANKTLARTTEGETHHDDETGRFAWHIKVLEDIFQDDAPDILESFTEDCEEASQVSTA